MSDDSALNEPLHLTEIRDLWPKSDDGRLCVRLLQRYTLSRLIASTAEAKCTSELAQSEGGASKVLAVMLQDFRTLTVPVEEKPPRKPLSPLNRFRSDLSSSSQPEKP